MVPMMFSLLVLSTLAAVGRCNTIPTRPGEHGEVTDIDVEAVAVMEKFAIIRWTNYNYTTDQGELMGWTINYRDAPARNITICNDKEACDVDGWKTVDIKAPPKDAAFIAALIVDLEPSTQYAVFVRSKHRDTDTRGVTSDILYFTTEAWPWG